MDVRLIGFECNIRFCCVKFVLTRKLYNNSRAFQKKLLGKIFFKQTNNYDYGKHSKCKHCITFTRIFISNINQTLHCDK